VILLAIVVAITLSNGGQTQAQPATQPASTHSQSSAASAIKQQSKPAHPAATITVCASGCNYTTIQAAVNAANNGDTIQVGAGNYVEQVMITKTLTLNGAGATSTYIRAPNPMTTVRITNPSIPSQYQDVADIVTISGTVSVNMSGFSVAGPGPGTCVISYGIFTVGGANVNFNNNHVYSVRDNPFSGCQNGIGIRVGSRFLGQAGSGIVSNSVFTDNQKSAIIFDGPGVSGTISGNTITGNGPTNITAQNGIQVSRSAVTTITNNVISGWYYSNYPNSASGCVEVYNAGNTTVANNLVSGCNVGIDPGNDEALTAIGSFTGNVVTGTNSAGDYGVAIGDGWGGSLVANNDVSNAIWGIYSYDVPVTITSNLAHGNSNGIYLDTFGGLNGAANDSISFNRIVSNTTGLFNNVPAPATAINNWWGCNAGPGGAGCDTVGGSLQAGKPERPRTVPVDGPAQGKRPVTKAKVAAPLGAITSNPWLTLNATVNPAVITVGQTAVDTGTLTINSASQDTSGLGHVRDYTPMYFTATLGTMSPPYTGTINGLASSTYTSNTPGPATVCTIVDSQTVCNNVTVNPLATATPTTTNTPTNTPTPTPTTVSTIVVVRPSNLQGWARYDENTATSNFVFGPPVPPYGIGSYQMQTGPGNGTNMGGKNYFATNTYSGTRLADITSLTYRAYIDLASQAAPQLDIVVELKADVNGDGTYDTTFVFEPVNSPDQGTPTPGIWQTWNARRGNWRITRPACGQVPNTYLPLDTFLAGCPTARMVQWYPRADGYASGLSAGQASGGAWANFIGYADGFEMGINYNSTIYDFEPDLPTATPTRTATVTPTATATTGLPTPVPTGTDTSTPTSTATNTPVPPTSTPTRTNTPVPPTGTPTRTNTPVPPTSTATNTPVPPTSTPTRTNTPVPPTNTATNTPVPPTSTATATSVPPTGTPTRTNTPVPPTSTATNTPVPPTNTATNTPVPPTSTATNTPVPPTGTPTRTNTPVPPTSTATNTPIVPTATPTDCPNPFVDINNNVFYYAIHYLYCRGVVNGVDPTHYDPAGTATRAQFAKVVVLGFGLAPYTPTGGGHDFTDVLPSYWAYSYIETGFHAGILQGFDQPNCASHNATYPCYLPNIPITRGQLTKLVVRAGSYTPYTPTGGGQDFTDVPPSYVFYVDIETAYHNNIINGYPDGTFRPNNNIRRDEMAQIVYEGIIHRP